MKRSRAGATLFRLFLPTRSGSRMRVNLPSRRRRQSGCKRIGTHGERLFFPKERIGRQRVASGGDDVGQRQSVFVVAQGMMPLTELPLADFLAVSTLLLLHGERGQLVVGAVCRGILAVLHLLAIRRREGVAQRGGKIERESVHLGGNHLLGLFVSVEGRITRGVARVEVLSVEPKDLGREFAEGDEVAARVVALSHIVREVDDDGELRPLELHLAGSLGRDIEEAALADGTLGFGVEAQRIFSRQDSGEPHRVGLAPNLRPEHRRAGEGCQEADEEVESHVGKVKVDGFDLRAKRCKS